MICLSLAVIHPLASLGYLMSSETHPFVSLKFGFLPLLRGVPLGYIPDRYASFKVSNLSQCYVCEKSSSHRREQYEPYIPKFLAVFCTSRLTTVKSHLVLPFYQVRHLIHSLLNLIYGIGCKQHAHQESYTYRKLYESRNLILSESFEQITITSTTRIPCCTKGG